MEVEGGDESHGGNKEGRWEEGGGAGASQRWWEDEREGGGRRKGSAVNPPPPLRCPSSRSNKGYVVANVQAELEWETE